MFVALPLLPSIAAFSDNSANGNNNTAAQMQPRAESGVDHLVRSIAEHVPSSSRPSSNQATCLTYFTSNSTYVETDCESVPNVPITGVPSASAATASDQTPATNHMAPLGSNSGAVPNTASQSHKKVSPDNSYSQTLNCDDSSEGYHCWAGYSYSDSNSPYDSIYGDNMLVPSVPSSSYSTPFALFWDGLVNCLTTCSPSTTHLVQSGLAYGWSGVTGRNSNNPTMFEEVVAPITIGGVDCSINFCGNYHAVSVGDNVTFGSEDDNGWILSAYDSTTGVDQIYQISTSTFQYSYLAYAESTFEGLKLNSTSNLPSMPAYGYSTEITDSSSPLNPITLTLSDWSAFDAPTSGSGITFTVYVTTQNSTNDEFEWTHS